MIERISGNMLEKNPTFCILDCHGLGVGLHISLNTFQHLQAVPEGAPVELHSYLHVREDALQLFGFYNMPEKEMFRLLISISGVGPKLALAILSGSTTDELKEAIGQEDIGMLTRIPGVGRKTAQRLILELKEKIHKQAELEHLGALTSLAGENREKLNEAIRALLSLGYKQKEAQQAVEKSRRMAGQDASLEELIKLSLKEL